MRRVNDLDEEAARKILIGVVQRVPSLIFNLLEHGGGDQPPTGGDNPPTQPNALEWCKCGNCRQMFTAQEEVCCENSPSDCLSHSADFELLVLEPAVVALAISLRWVTRMKRII